MRNKAILILYLTPIFTKILDKQIALASQESQKQNLRNWIFFLLCVKFLFLQNLYEPIDQCYYFYRQNQLSRFYR